MRLLGKTMDPVHKTVSTYPGGCHVTLGGKDVHEPTLLLNELDLVRQGGTLKGTASNVQ